MNDHSTHRIDAAFRANPGNLAAFAAGVLAYAKGNSLEPIHMECSTRTNLMGRIFDTLRYETRVVAIFNSSNLNSHTYLEVRNPVTGKWEAQDADYDIWRSKVSGERISLAEAAEALDPIEPCGRIDCGWHLVSREGIPAKNLRTYLDIISITAKQKSMRFSLYTSRANLGKIYRTQSKQGTFCEVEAKRCGHGFFEIVRYSTYAPGLIR